MGRKATPGLYKPDEIWHIDKWVRRVRIRESTGTSSLDEAERYLAKRISEVKGAILYGDRPTYTFVDAATKYLQENMHLASIADDASRLKRLLKHIGTRPLDQVHNTALAPYRDEMRKEGLKSKSVNNGFELVRRILRKAATTWHDELSNQTWIAGMPVIENVNWNDKRDAYPISWTEQKFLMAELAPHLQEPALYALHTGCREQEICQLRWDWEVAIPELDEIIFVLPGWVTKNKEERVVVLNSVAKSVINAQRGKHPSRVFTYQRGKVGQKKTLPLDKVYNSGWKAARERAADAFEKEMEDTAPWGFRHLRVHDLRHTFGRRLRAAGVNKETRGDLLGHKSGDITTHYSAAELQELIEAVGSISESNLPKNYQLTLVRAVAQK